MRRIALVRSRTGEVVPFDESSVAEAVHRALLSAGNEDRALAGEIASVVTLFLEKTYYDDVPGVEQVLDMVEKVLVEMGHAQAAKAFILQRAHEARIREAESALSDVGPTLFETGAIVVEDAVRGVSHAFSRESLARTLAADGSVTRAEADLVAAATETRLRRAGVARASAGWVRAVAEVELLERSQAAGRSGALADPRRRAAASIDASVVAAALVRRGSADAPVPPDAAARDLGGRALRAYAVAELLPPEAARAHMDGEIHVHGLERPSSLFSVAFGAEAFAPESATTPRRLVSSIARSVRLASAASIHVRVQGAAVSLARQPSRQGTAGADLFPDGSGAVSEVSAAAASADVTDDAWQLLADASSLPGDAPAELDLTPSLQDPRSCDVAAEALRLAARGTGLPPRETLPVVVVGFSSSLVADPRSLKVLRLAADAALRGERVVFPLLRDERRPAGTIASRAASGSAASCTAGRVTLNLPRAARQCGRGQVDRFLRDLDRLVDLAVAAHAARRVLLAQTATAAGGALAPWFRGVRGRTALLDLGGAPWSVAVTGLNEALVHLTGFELHEDDESAQRAAKRIVSYLSVRVREAGLRADLPCVLDADHDADVARRFYSQDVQADAERTTSALSAPGYAPGVSCRHGSPADALLVLEREDALHASLTTSVVRLPFSAREAGGPDGVLALLGKALAAGRAGQAEVAPW